jgi:hypothetical protein
MPAPIRSRLPDGVGDRFRPAGQVTQLGRALGDEAQTWSLGDTWPLSEPSNRLEGAEAGGESVRLRRGPSSTFADDSLTYYPCDALPPSDAQ